jgi:hypothetical protein
MDTQKKYSYKLIFIFTIFVSQIGFSQKIIMKENVPTDFIHFNMEKGPNKKKYSFLEFSVGTLLPISLNGDESMAIKPSFDYQLSASFKRKISPILSFINVLGVSNLRFQAKSIYELNDFGISSSALNPKFSIWNLMCQSGFRFNMDPNRGNQIGKYIEMNLFGFYTWNSTLKYEYNTNLNDKTIIKERNPNLISNLHYGIKMKLGIKSKSIFGLYRLSHFLENSDFPGLLVGFSSTIGNKTYR